jgi:23S rRNA (adenine2503-C2)-methyltransferase
VKTSFYELNFTELQDIFLENQFSQKSASLLYNWYFKKNQRQNLDHQDLSKKARDYISENFIFDLPEIDFVQQSTDRTVKFLFKMQDGYRVESVLIPFQGKYTICLSSQVGCAMNCAFCFTGKQGYTRNLKTHEIVGQFMQAKTWLTQNRPDDDRILNIVFMGQGEPLHNFDSVKKACEIFLSQHGLSLASHKITISTSGYLPGLKRWKAEMPDVNIALSLHSPITEKRNELIPINKKYPLSEVIDLVEQIPQEEKRFVTYEYLLIADFNDTEADAKATGELLKHKKAFINLIPFNPYPDSHYKRPSLEKVEAFKSVLENFKIPVTVRTTKGDQILAACGQLNTSNKH